MMCGFLLFTPCRCLFFYIFIPKLNDDRPGANTSLKFHGLVIFPDCFHSTRVHDRIFLYLYYLSKSLSSQIPFYGTVNYTIRAPMDINQTAFREAEKKVFPTQYLLLVFLDLSRAVSPPSPIFFNSVQLWAAPAFLLCIASMSNSPLSPACCHLQLHVFVFGDFSVRTRNILFGA